MSQAAPRMERHALSLCLLQRIETGRPTGCFKCTNVAEAAWPDPAGERRYDGRKWEAAAMNRSLTSALLAVTLTLGCGGVAVAQAPMPVQANIAITPDAAAQGNAGAQNNLGVSYYMGNGVAQDYKEAARLFGLAAAQGNASAQSNLALAEAALAKQAAGALAEARKLAADRAQQEAEAQAQVQAQVKDAAECESFGAAFGSPAYVQCRISLKALRQGVSDNQKTAEQDKTRADLLKAQSEQQQRQAAAQQAAQRDDRALLGLAGALLNGINNAEAAQKARLGVSTSCNTVGTRTSCTSN